MSGPIPSPYIEMTELVREGSPLTPQKLKLYFHKKKKSRRCKTFQVQWGLVVIFRVWPDVLSLYKSRHPPPLPLLSGKLFPFQNCLFRASVNQRVALQPGKTLEVSQSHCFILREGNSPRRLSDLHIAIEKFYRRTKSENRTIDSLSGALYCCLPFPCISRRGTRNSGAGLYALPVPSSLNLQHFSRENSMCSVWGPKPSLLRAFQSCSHCLGDDFHSSQQVAVCQEGNVGRD